MAPYLMAGLASFMRDGHHMKFPIIYADPAWVYDDKALAGDRGAGCKYSLTTIEDMKAFPVADISAQDAVLFMWATYPQLQEALDLGKAWGFTYKTVAFTWVKPSGPYARIMEYLRSPGWSEVTLFHMAKEWNTDWFIGMGRWTRSNAEVCLLFTKGKPKRVDAGVNQIICAPRMAHSAKPPETRDRIKRLMGDLDAVELFARDSAAGWVALGNEIDGEDLKDSIPALARL